MACKGCLDANCLCIYVVVAEKLADVRGQYDVTHAKLVVSLSDDDRGTRTLGYAQVRAATVGNPARFSGLAVTVSGVDGVPDPIVISVEDDPAFEHIDKGGQLIAPILRSALPLLIRVDSEHREVEAVRTLPNTSPKPAPTVETQATIANLKRGRKAKREEPPAEASE